MGCGKIKALLHACIYEHYFTTKVTTRRSGDGGPRAETRFLGLLRRNGLTVVTSVR